MAYAVITDQLLVPLVTPQAHEVQIIVLQVYSNAAVPNVQVPSGFRALTSGSTGVVGYIVASFGGSLQVFYGAQGVGGSGLIQLAGATELIHGFSFNIPAEPFPDSGLPAGAYTAGVGFPIALVSTSPGQVLVGAACARRATPGVNVWADGLPPSVSSDGEYVVGSARSFAGFAHVGVAAGGPVGTQAHTNGALAGIVVFAVPRSPSAPPVPIYPTRQDARDRLRSSVTEDTGSLLDAVEAIPVDARATEAYTRAQNLQPQALTLWREALRDKDGPPDFSYYPRPRQNTVEESQYDGVTVLSRLRNFYPPRVFATTTELGLPDPASAQEILTYLLSSWVTQVPWLTYAPVPDLRYRLPGFAPSDYGPEDGPVTSHVVAFPQGRDDRRDALTIIEDLLSPFPGAVARQTSDGDLIIVTPYGPDADETPYLRLSGHDAYSVSRGDPDPYSVTNRATYSSQGWERHEEVATMQPAWFQVGSAYQWGRPTWYTPPVDRLNLQPTDDGTGILQEDQMAWGDNFNRQLPQIWPIGSDAIPAGTGISLRDGNGDPTITGAWSRYIGNSLDGSGAGTVVLLEDEIPFDGQWRTTFQFQETAEFGTRPIRITVACRWNPTLHGVEFRFRDPISLQSACSLGTCRGWVVEFTLNDSSVAYAPGSINTGTYGVIDPLDPENSDSLPGEGGVNAIEVSQAAFGILEANVRIRGYVLRPDVLAQIAQAHVLETITPSVTRELEISIFSGLRVQFDHIGRLTELPNGDEGYVTGVTYGDDFEVDRLGKTARVQVRDYAAPGAIDNSTGFLTLLNGSFWQFIEPPLLPIEALEQP